MLLVIFLSLLHLVLLDCRALLAVTLYFIIHPVATSSRAERGDPVKLLFLPRSFLFGFLACILIIGAFSYLSLIIASGSPGLPRYARSDVIFHYSPRCQRHREQSAAIQSNYISSQIFLIWISCLSHNRCF